MKKQTVRRELKNMFVAQFETSEQYTEDSFRARRPCMEVTPDTTIRDIYDWYRLAEKFGHMEVTIIQMEEPQKAEPKEEIKHDLDLPF